MLYPVHCREVRVMYGGGTLSRGVNLSMPPTVKLPVGLVGLNKY